MFELVFAVCLVDEPTRCREERMSIFQNSVSAGQCMMMGQIEIAKWMDGHPNFVLKRWRCQPAGQVAKI